MEYGFHFFSSISVRHTCLTKKHDHRLTSVRDLPFPNSYSGLAHIYKLCQYLVKAANLTINLLIL